MYNERRQMDGWNRTQNFEINPYWQLVYDKAWKQFNRGMGKSCCFL